MNDATRQVKKFRHRGQLEVRHHYRACCSYLVRSMLECIHSANLKAKLPFVEGRTYMYGSIKAYNVHNLVKS